MNKIYGSSYQPDNYSLEKMRNKVDQLQKGLQGKITNKEDKLMKACEEFEAVFFQMVLKEMRKTVDKSGLTDGGYAEEIFESMMDEEIAKSAAKKEGSLANLLYQQLRLQLDGEE